MRRDGSSPFGVVTGVEMTALDRKAIDEYRIPAAALMERAGAEVADVVAELIGEPIAGARILVVCGTGNNGGDGFVAARTLANLGAWCVFSHCATGASNGRAGLLHGSRQDGNSRSDDRRGRPTRVYLSTQDGGRDRRCNRLARASRGPYGPLSLDWSRRSINLSGQWSPSIFPPVYKPIPAGWIPRDQSKDDRSLGLPKVGHLLHPGRAHTGELRVAPIGFPRPLLESASGRLLTDREWARAAIAPRPSHGHKGTLAGGRHRRVRPVWRERLLLAMKGALRSGAGLVTWLGPGGLLPIVQTLVPEATASPCLEGEGVTSARSARSFGSPWEKDAVAIGPGLGTGGGSSTSLCSSSMLAISVPLSWMRTP